MRIVFICGSLESGKDGVGDYTRCLAGELIRHGHNIGIVALNDKGIDRLLCGHQEDNDTKIPILRIPKSISAKKRFEFAKEWIDLISPEWLSLQFVPFSFNPYGLPFALAWQLKAMSQNTNWHVMFHELWVGMDIKDNYKLIFWGRLQKEIVKTIIKNLKPKVINTQTNLYLKTLTRMGYAAKRLPLFSSIPLKEKESNTKYEINNDVISFVIFGSIHYGAPIEDFAKELTVYTTKRNIQVVFRFIGQCGAEIDNWLVILKKYHFKVEVLGQQNREIISEVLSVATFGISTTPTLLVEKSSTVAAMLEHKLSIITVARQWTPRGFESDELPSIVSEYQKGNLSLVLERRTISMSENGATTIACQLIRGFGT